MVLISEKHRHLNGNLLACHRQADLRGARGCGPDQHANGARERTSHDARG